MSKLEDFLSQSDEEEIIQAIKTAEKNTSGEIRVHVENSLTKEHFDRALEVFHSLNMNLTKLKNGVLIYVAVNDKKFVIYGGEGINKVVEPNFWNSTKDAMQAHFKNGKFKEGIVSGILKAGEKLQTHFPHQKNDTNELSNEISKGKL
jgi:uncharacterized membrane protein